MVPALTPMSILLTKVRQPQKRKDILRRVRLVDTIHQNIHRKLTFVSAPAGYGKTTLLTDFASDVDANVCWYLIGAEDKNPIDFVRHIVASFQQQFKGFGEDLEQTLSLSETEHSISSLAVELINEVETEIDDFTILVLDDYHLAGENEEIVEFIEKLIEHLPDQLRVLIGSRSVYGIPAANLYIRDELVTISADELRFRPEELQRLIAQNYQFNLSDEQAEEFAQQSDGWIVAILLALRATDNLGSIPKLVGGTERVYEYLAEEVVSQQSSELRDFMYCTSILGDFDEKLCNYVRDEGDSAEFLQLLEDRNLFVTRTEGTEGPSYRYHQLFAEFLTEQFRKHDPARLYRMHSRAADWHRERKEWDAAVQHKLDSGDHEQAAKWIDDIAHHFYTGGRQNEIVKWFRNLDKLGGVKRHAPHLVLYQAKILGEQQKIAEAEKALTLCEPALKRQKDLIAIANVYITRGMLLRAQQDHDGAMDWAEQSLDTLSGVPVGNEKTHQILQAKRLIAFSQFSLGQARKSRKNLEGVVRDLQSLVTKSKGIDKQRFSFDLAASLSDLGLLALFQGDILASQQAYEEALAIHKKISGNHGALALAHNNIAYVLHISGRLKNAWRHYSLGLEHAVLSGRQKEELSIKAGQGSVLIDLEEYEAAEEILDATAASARSLGDTRALKESYRNMAELLRRQGRLTEAINFLRDAFSHEGRGIFSAPYYIGLAEIYLDMNHIDLAKEQLEHASKEMGNGADDKDLLAIYEFQLSRLSLKQNKTDEAESFLSASLKRTAALGYDQFLVSSAKTALVEIEELADQSSNNQIADFTTRVKRPQQFKGLYQQSENPKDLSKLSLQIKSLGEPEVRANGELIPPSAWKSSRARALFHFIVDRKKIRKEEAGIDFWPDFSPGKMSSNFHATLWRARRALADPEIIVFMNDRYQINPDVKLWYDADEFEHQIRQASQSSKGTTAWVEHLNRAIEIYTGPYLSNLFFDWTNDRRLELEKQYMGALLSLARHEQSRKNHKGAVAKFELLLEVDPYMDQVHLELMDSLAESGQVDLAKKHFRDYKELLRTELNSDPIPNLQRYYDQMTT